MRIREVIESHDSSSPLFLYAALQTVHQPLEVPQVGLYPIHYCPFHLSLTFFLLRNTLTCIPRLCCQPNERIMECCQLWTNWWVIWCPVWKKMDCMTTLSSFGLATMVHCHPRAQIRLCVETKLNFMRVEFEFQALCIRQTRFNNLGKSTDMY